jgi:uncharacterized protein (UPF0332 family)
LGFLEQKSLFNQSGAELLIEKGYYAPSVHCSYYSVFQKLICIVLLKRNISHDDLDDEIEKVDKGSHNYVLDQFCNFISDYEKQRLLKRKIKDLKQYRADSDYGNIEIDYMVGSSAFELSKEIIKEINGI